MVDVSNITLTEQTIYEKLNKLIVNLLEDYLYY